MRGSYFIPARDSRHRTACFALYRALVRQAALIPLPSSLLQAGRSHASADSLRNPIQVLIERQFRRNKGDVSPRLVYAALTAGYKFLTLFSKAQTPGSPEHSSVISLLNERAAVSASVRGHNAVLKPRPKQVPHPPKPPLLTRLSEPDDQGRPVYASTVRPRPLAQLKGERRVPRLCATAQGTPFLRFGKPQGERISMILLKRDTRHRKRMELGKRLQDEARPEAAEEDRWESILAALVRSEKEGGEMSESEREVGRDGNATYERSVVEGIRDVWGSLDRERLDNIARARAMLDIVKEETAMAEEERRARGQAENAD